MGNRRPGERRQLHGVDRRPERRGEAGRVVHAGERDPARQAGSRQCDRAEARGLERRRVDGFRRRLVEARPLRRHQLGGDDRDRGREADNGRRLDHVRPRRRRHPRQRRPRLHPAPTPPPHHPIRPAPRRHRQNHGKLHEHHHGHHDPLLPRNRRVNSALHTATYGLESFFIKHFHLL